MMDVDDLATHRRAQRRRQNLHVPRQNDQIDVVLPDQLQDLALLLGFGGCRHGEMVKGDLVGVGQGLEVRVVGDDERDLDAQLGDALAKQEIVQAVPDLRHHDEHPGLLGQGVQLEIHAHVLSDVRKRRIQFLDGELLGLGCSGGGRGRREMHSHEEAQAGGIAKLLRVDNVEIVLGEESRDGMDDAWTIRT